MKSTDRQRGMTAIGWLMVLGLIAFFSLIGLRLVPVYLEYFSVVTALESLKKNSDISSDSPRQVVDALMRRLDISDVKSVKPANVKVLNEGGALKVAVNYEVRVPLMGNLDALATFNKSVELR